MFEMEIQLGLQRNHRYNSHIKGTVLRSPVQIRPPCCITFVAQWGQIINSVKMAGWVRNKNVKDRNHWTVEWQQQIYPHVVYWQKAEVFLRCLFHHILLLITYTFQENRQFVFIIIMQFMIVQIFGHVLACRSCSFVCTLHHLIIIIVKTYLKTLNL